MLRKDWKKGLLRLLPYFLAFVLPVLVVLMAVMLAPIRTFLLSDGKNQYVRFLAYFRSTFFENNNFDYMNSMFLGTNGMATAGYYMLSPFNFITLLFPVHLISVAFAVIILLKIGMAGVFSYVFFRYVIGNDKKIESLFCAISFALCGFVVVYFWNVMWLDGVVILPLICLGIKKIIDNKRPWVYIISLSYAIITNYYIAFMLCIFSVVFFLYELMIVIKKFDFENIKLRISTLTTYVMSSMLSVGLAAFVLLPIIFDLSAQGSGRIDILNFAPKMNFPLIDIFKQLTGGAVNGSHYLISGLPNIFIGTVGIILSLFYFYNKKISLKEKVLSGLVLGVFFISFNVRSFNAIWHGGTTEAWFPFRYAFVVSFFLLYLAAKLFKHIDDIKKESCIKVFLVYVITVFLVFRDQLSITKTVVTYVEIFLVLLVSYLLYIKSDRSNVLRKNVLLMVLLLLQLGDLTMNTILSIRKLSSGELRNFASYSMQRDISGGEELRKIVNKIKSDNSLYRIDNEAFFTPNDASEFNYASVSGFNSSIRKDVWKFFKNLGGYFVDTSIILYLGDSTITSDSLFGVKYLFGVPKSAEHFAGLEKLNNEKILNFSVNTYKNPYALPLIFATKDDEIKIDSSLPILRQNEIYKKISGLDKDIFKEISYDEILENLKDVGDYYERVDKTKPARIKYVIKNTTDSQVYVYHFSPNIKDIDINNERARFNRSLVADFDLFPVSKTKDILLTTPGDKIYKNKIAFYTEDLNVLKEHTEEIKKSDTWLKKISSSHFIGEVEIKEGGAKGVILTMPYDKNWKVMVDGKMVSTKKVMEILQFIPIEQNGKHKVEMIYVPKGKTIGTAISVISLLILLTWIFICRR